MNRIVSSGWYVKEGCSSPGNEDRCGCQFFSSGPTNKKEMGNVPPLPNAKHTHRNKESLEDKEGRHERDHQSRLGYELGGSLEVRLNAEAHMQPIISNGRPDSSRMK